MNFVQVMLRCGLCHEMPDAIVQSSLNDEIRAEGIGGAFILDRRPFSKSSRGIKIDLNSCLPYLEA